MTKRIHVAVGVIFNHDNQILLAKRPEHLHQGGKWEFPESPQKITAAKSRIFS